ncbi:type VI secretion system Vgr family protein [Variovorax paradoxus]|uniref:Actin cross-linking toxin VgrG1 n=1 Tax=Variovorax paradoxus TaxID=34073 RepID=A0A679JSA4_VARPD|nr:Actin cross-linking toxin VgrG1 [Variovorax paradoxus]
MTRSFIAHTELGERLKFRSMTGQERISTLFEYRVRLISDSAGIAAKSVLGKDMSIEVNLSTELGGAGKRFLSGQATRFTYIGKDDGDMHIYEAELRPWLWYATRRSDFKIFQSMTAPQMLHDVLGRYGFSIEDRFSGSYRTWDYCVQYDETDFGFASRLMEQEGLYYHFEHAQGSHKLVLCDGPASHTALPNGPGKIPYHAGVLAAQVLEQDFIDTWQHREDVASGLFAANDYDFTKPNAEIDTARQQRAGHERDDYELYEWPGGYTELGDGENYARVRIEQQGARRELITGHGPLRHMAPGHTFELARHPRSQENGRFLIEAVTFDFQENALRQVGAADADYAEGTSGTSYRQTFEVLPEKASYRAARVTPKPRTTGPQTAVVVGPAGEEIYTDEYGRIKVQFHWDRYGKMDEHSSCWIRVSQTWAGSNYGTMHVPRIGQEVIVDFLNGDPDHPIVTGRVYNAAQMPPWELPAHKTQSGILTRSSQGGTPGDGLRDSPGTANALRFEDKAGQEQLWLHAQKDQLTEVEHDEDKWVGNDRRKTIDRDEFNTVHRDRTEVVDRNEKIDVHGWRTEEVDLDETITIHQNRKERVDLNETISIGRFKMQTVGIGYTQNVGVFKVISIGVSYMENIGVSMMTNVGKTQDLNVGEKQTVQVGQVRETDIGKNDTLRVGDTLTVHGRKLAISADEEITLSCGSSTIRITAGQIEILSPLDKLNC